MPLRDHFRPPLDDETSWDALHGAWRSRLGGLGEPVRVETDAGAVEGTFLDVDRGGALVLETPQGRQRVLVGDVILGPRAGGAGG